MSDTAFKLTNGKGIVVVPKDAADYSGASRSIPAIAVDLSKLNEKRDWTVRTYLDGQLVGECTVTPRTTCADCGCDLAREEVGVCAQCQREQDARDHVQDWRESERDRDE